MSQIALPLDWPADAGDQSFIHAPSNAAALRHLDHWSLWPVMATILIGPRKSGRSLLGRIFAAKTGGALCDDAEAADAEALFHRWNNAQAERRPLLIIADRRTWPVALPDLASRLAATPRVAIDAPDDGLVRQLIERGLAARGLPTPTGLTDFLTPRIERSHVAIERVIDALDQAALATRRRLTLPLAKASLSQAGLLPTEPRPRA